jgi:hypothetical protein
MSASHPCEPWSCYLCELQSTPDHVVSSIERSAHRHRATPTSTHLRDVLLQRDLIPLDAPLDLSVCCRHFSDHSGMQRLTTPERYLLASLPPVTWLPAGNSSRRGDRVANKRQAEDDATTSRSSVAVPPSSLHTPPHPGGDTRPPHHFYATRAAERHSSSQLSSNFVSALVNDFLTSHDDPTSRDTSRSQLQTSALTGRDCLVRWERALTTRSVQSSAQWRRGPRRRTLDVAWRSAWTAAHRRSFLD